MLIELTEDELEILRCWKESWDDIYDEPHMIPGGISYQQVYNLCNKLQITHPINLVKLLQKYQAIADITDR